MSKALEKRFRAPKKVSLAGKILGDGLSIAGAELSNQWFNVTTEEIEAAVSQMSDVTQKIEQLKDGVRSIELKRKIDENVTELKAQLEVVKQAKATKQIELVMAGFRSWFDVLQRIIYGIWPVVYDLLIIGLGPEKEMDIYKAKKKADLFVTIMGDINVIAGVLDIIGDIHLFGCKLPGSAIGRMIRNISWTFGLGWISWLTLSPTVQYGIVEWYDRWYKEFVRPEKPTRTTIEDMYARDLIDENRFHDEMARLGYPDWLIEWHRQLTHKQLSLSQIMELRQRGIISEAEFDKYVRTLGYHEPERTLLKALLVKQATETTVKEAYKRELISEEEYKRLLKEYGYDGVYLDLILNTTHDLLGKETLDKLLTLGYISAEEYVRRIRQLGYSDDDAQLVLKSTYKTATKESIKALMERGLIHEEEAREWLRKQGYVEDALEIEHKAMMVGVESSEMNNLISQAESEYAAGYLSEAELYEIYKFAGLPDNIAAIRIWRARLRLLDSINDQLKKYYIELYEKGMISIAELRERLSGIIKSPELLEAIIDYEIAKKEGKKEVEETLKLRDKMMKLQLKRDSLMKQLQYLITVRSEEERYYKAKIEILLAKLETAIEEQKPIIARQLEETEAKMNERLAYLDTKIEQVKNAIAAVDVDIDAIRRAAS